LNVRHIGTVEATSLKFIRGYFQWYDRPAEFHEDQPVGSKVVSGGQMDSVS
jgi:hypothetical protein